MKQRKFKLGLMRRISFAKNADAAADFYSTDAQSLANNDLKFYSTNF